MKKFFVVAMFTFSFTISAFGTRDAIKRNGYTVKFNEKSPEMAATLHVIFVGTVPKLNDVEKIVKQKLRIYGNKLTNTEKRTRYKNIIGSAWKANTTDPVNLTKIKFAKDLSAYVWLGKTKSIVTFPQYMEFLKKEKNTSEKIQNTTPA